MLELSLFFILALFTLGGSITMVVSFQPLFSAFGFLIAMLGLAGIFALLNNQFLALAQIMVSVGAVVILSMLTIMTVNAQAKNLPKEPYKFIWILLSSFLIAPITVLIYTQLSTLPTTLKGAETITAKVIGNALFTDWVFPFEIVSILLLTAMVGAIVIGRKHLLDTKACS